MWVFGAALSAFLLGIYDIFKKTSLNENAVIPVLFFSTLSSALIFAPFLILSRTTSINLGFLYIAPQTLDAHLHFFLKSVIVGTSWFLAYFAIKNLPITIIAPIQSSGPLWTVIGAILIYSETLSHTQWLGVAITIGFYYVFSLYGKKEGISFRNNKWVFLMVLSTIINSISGLYDKFLVNHYDRIAMQCWFSIYMVPIFSIMLLAIWLPNRTRYTPFKWRYSIVLIGITLIIADFIYFWALKQQGALISIVATIRRGSVVVSFSLGAILFREKNIKIKALILAGILAGIGLIILGS
jgi:bacterial/archaeal transporter family protein